MVAAQERERILNLSLSVARDVEKEMDGREQNRKIIKKVVTDGLSHLFLLKICSWMVRGCLGCQNLSTIPLFREPLLALKAATPLSTIQYPTIHTSSHPPLTALSPVAPAEMEDAPLASLSLTHVHYVCHYRPDPIPNSALTTSVEPGGPHILPLRLARPRPPRPLRRLHNPHMGHARDRDLPNVRRTNGLRSPELLPETPHKTRATKT